ncbi:MAG: 3'-5' exonuclease, partial [Ruminiclostridium sp.]
MVKYNQDARDLSVHCMNKNIPYYISKHNFDRTDFVKWLEGCAAWVYDKTSMSFDDIYSFWEELVLLHREDKFISETDRLNKKKWLFNVLLNTDVSKENLLNWLKSVLADLDINAMLLDSEVYPDELDNIKKLLEEAADEQYKDYDISKFSKLGKPDNQVTLSTRHSSKGLEFEVVIMLGLEEGNFPDYRKVDNPDELAEENRMCFVCVSRAKRVCILIASKHYAIPKQDGGTWTKQCKPSIYWKQLFQ